MFQLRLFGTIELRAPDGRELSAVLRQPKRAALLAYLAAARQDAFHRRDTLLALFWPEFEQTQARNALNSALGYLRQEIGRDAVISRGDNDVAIATAQLWADVPAFERLITAGEHKEALELYRGDMLEGFHLARCPEFGEWLDRERARLRCRAAQAARSLSDRLAETKDLVGAIDYARRTVSLSPDDERARRRLIELLAAAGDRAAALRTYGEFVAWLHTEFQSQPAAETTALVDAIRTGGTGLAPSPTARAQASSHRYQTASEVPPALALPQERRYLSGPAAQQPVVKPTVRFRRRHVITTALAVAAVAAILWRVRESRIQTTAIQSIVVLPFDNLTGGAEQEYFVAGLHDALLAELSRVSALRTIARTSAQQSKATGHSLARIASDLNVDAVVEGSALRSGDSIRLNLRLISPVNERQLWARAFDGEFKNVLALLKDATRVIADQAGVPLTKRERARLGEARAVNPVAHEMYLRGLYDAESFTPEGLTKGIGLLREAKLREPKNPLPYAALARAYTYSGVGHGNAVARRAAFAEAKNLATKAIELDETSSDAHVWLGAIHLFHDWDWVGAEREFRRAIALEPNSSNARWGYALYLTAMLRFDEAIAENVRAKELDPLSRIILGDLAVRYYVAGKYDSAIVWAQKALDLEPSFPPALWVLGVAYRAKRSYVQAIQAHERAAAGNPVFKSHLAVTYAIAGRTQAARQLLAEMDDAARRRAAFNMAQIHVALGEREEGLRWLEVAYDEHHPWLHWIRLEPTLATLRSEPRYQALLRRMHLPEP